jgi:aryl carrier-like protein
MGPKPSTASRPQPTQDQIAAFLKKYFASPVSEAVEHPNVIKVNKPTIGKAEKSASEVLTYVLNGLLPGFEKDKNLFEQGLTSLDVMKIVTRCGEYGYQIDMATIFLTPTFEEIVAEMKP